MQTVGPKHARLLALALSIVTVAAVAVTVHIVRKPSTPPVAYQNAMTGANAPDASASQLFSYFKIPLPDMPYAYTGSLHGAETPLLAARLTATCDGIRSYAADDGLKPVNDLTFGDGNALSLATSDGESVDAISASFGKEEDLEAGTAKVEIILFGSGAKCEGYLGAAFS